MNLLCLCCYRMNVAEQSHVSWVCVLISTQPRGCDGTQLGSTGTEQKKQIPAFTGGSFGGTVTLSLGISWGTWGVVLIGPLSSRSGFLHLPYGTVVVLPLTTLHFLHRCHVSSLLLSGSSILNDTFHESTVADVVDTETLSPFETLLDCSTFGCWSGGNCCSGPAVFLACASPLPPVMGLACCGGLSFPKAVLCRRT